FIFLAQHKETMYEIMEQFGIKKPDIVIGDLGRDITSVGDMLLWSLRVLAYAFFNKRKIFRQDRSGVVLIHGDAPPLLLGGLIARFQGLKVAQIEAGLRSFNFFKPFPEELTRVLAARMGLIDIFFCQDDRAMQNVAPFNKQAHCTRFNTMLDALRIAQAASPNGAPSTDEEKYALVSLHRFETISNKEKLAKAVEHILNISRKIKLRFILHPPTRVALKKFGLYDVLEREENCEMMSRLGFFEFNKMFRKAEFIISDGGSNQEESFYMGIPCLLFRNETERMEGMGKNVVLSRFDSSVIEQFVDHYPDYRIDPVADTESPTRFIIDQLKGFA
ncbi:MAG: UDP-N-acetylglucosamine 2-epimerase, partial [Nitrospinae bacterium]|nr:UDP-N-acetylglucosamine 2-epimerase [Nitrospinota bacterium]